MSTQIKWPNYPQQFGENINALWRENCFIDVTLVCDDGKVSGHKVIISSCSYFFQKVLKENIHEHPLIYLKGIKIGDLNNLLTFMYLGEVSIEQNSVQSFLSAAKDLKIKGLTDDGLSPVVRDDTASLNSNLHTDDILSKNPPSCAMEQSSVITPTLASQKMQNISFGAPVVVDEVGVTVPVAARSGCGVGDLEARHVDTVHGPVVHAEHIAHIDGVGEVAGDAFAEVDGAAGMELEAFAQHRNAAGDIFDQSSVLQKLSELEKQTMELYSENFGPVFGTPDNFDLDSHLPVVPLPCNTPDPLQCDKCKKVFKRKSNFTTHMIKCQDTQKEKIDKCTYTCEKCGKSFDRPSKFQSHVLSCKAKTIVCDICGICVKTKDALRTHRSLRH